MANEQNLKPWRKGESGNPSGRPGKSVITELLRETLPQPCSEDKLGRSYAHMIALAMVKRAAKGDLRAVREILDRMEGRPAQAQSEDGNAVQVVLIGREREPQDDCAPCRLAGKRQRKKTARPSNPNPPAHCSQEPVDLLRQIERIVQMRTRDGLLGGR